MMSVEGSTSNYTFMHCIQELDSLENSFEAFCGWQNCETCLIGKRRCRGLHKKVAEVRNVFHEVLDKIREEQKKGLEE